VHSSACKAAERFTHFEERENIFQKRLAFFKMPTDMNKNAVNDVHQFMKNLELSAK